MLLYSVFVWDMIKSNLKLSIKCPVKYFDIFVRKLIN